MSESGESEASTKDDNVDLQMAFVMLLEDHKVLFDKRQTPGIKERKEKAAGSVANAYGKVTNQEFTAKQILKKLNNMKTKVKNATDLKKTGNKKIILTPWQKKFYDLWNDEDNQGENPVLHRVPGGVMSSVLSSSSKLVNDPPVKKRKILEPEAEISYSSTISGSSTVGGPLEAYTLQQLQRMCLVAQIKAAQAQETAAKEMEKYYLKKKFG